MADEGGAAKRSKRDASSLAAMLVDTSENVEERERAAGDLGLLGASAGDEGTRACLAALREKGAGAVRYAALRAFAKLGEAAHPHALEAWSACADDPELVLDARDVLERFGDKALASLGDGLVSGDGATRLSSVKGLIVMGEKAAPFCRTLAEALGDAEKNAAPMRRLCATALGLVGEAAKPFAAAIADAADADADEGVRVSALNALQKAGVLGGKDADKYIEAALDAAKGDAERCAAIDALSSLGKEESSTHASSLAAVMQDEEASAEVRIHAARFLGSLGASAIGDWAGNLIEQMNTSYGGDVFAPGRRVRWAAVEALARLGPEHADVLGAALGSDDFGVQEGAVAGLRSMGEAVLRRFAGRLKQCAAGEETHEDVIVAVQDALEDIGEEC